MKYHLIVFGCQMNEADSQKLISILKNKGFEQVQKINEADLVIIVMCSVRQSAVDRIFGIAEKLKKLTKKPTTILTGCILKKDKKTFSEKFDYVLNTSEALKLISEVANSERAPQPRGLVARSAHGARTELVALATSVSGESLPSGESLSSEKRAYITISNGCNNFCTYCVVPYTRGRLICIDHKKILAEAKRVIKNNSKELWLLGQNVNDYCSPSDKSITFPELLELVNDLPGDFKIYFMSPNPKNFSDKLIKVMAKSKKFSRYLNLPVQAGDDQILRRMNRPYTAKKYITLVNNIRKAIPNINLSTDVIVGFPGETKKQFENTAKLFRKIKFNIAYINKYSPRWGTAASKLKNDVPWAEKKRREKILIDIVNGNHK